MIERFRWLPLSARALLACLLVASAAIGAQARAAEPSVPAVLEPWRAWVMDRHPDAKCPPRFDEAQNRSCVWIDSLTLELGRTGGKFAAEIDVFADANVFLPGSGDQWPADARSNNAPALVTARDGRPNLHLAPGHYSVTGSWQWAKLPDSIELPQQHGLLRMSIDGAAVPQPLFDGSRVWLGKGPTAATDVPNDTLTVRVFRKLADGVPMKLETYLDLFVAGSHRVVSLGRAVPEGFAVTATDSPLPMRVDPNGHVKVQVEPGEWQVRIDARALSAPTRFAAQPETDNWPAEEIWGFAADRSLRVVDVGGATPIDLSQTNAPFADIPAYVVTASNALTITEQFRGDPNPSPNDFTLARDLWLAFDGGNYTARDTLTGMVQRPTRLSASFVPGRITIDDAPQLITQLGDAQPGIELANGNHTVVAISEMPRADLATAVGWQTDVKQLSGELHLPPGWRLLWTHGVDRAPTAWLAAWTLWDIFVVVICAALALRLFGTAAAALFAIALALVYQEPGAPTLIWIVLLLLLAVQNLGRGRLAELVRVTYYAALALTVCAVLGFAIDNFRIAIYPQLERTGGFVAAPPPGKRLLRELSAGAPEPLSAGMAARSDVQEVLLSTQKVRPARFDRYETNTQVQTGPGVPQWQWRDEALIWDGPVTAAQPIELALSPPWLTRAWHVVGPLLLFVLIALFAAKTLPPTAPMPAWLRRLAPPAAAIVIVAGFAHAPDAHADIPTPELLNELEHRLTQPPECMPACAAVAHATVKLGGDSLTVRLEINAVDTVALPLPAVAARWWPTAARDGDRGAVVGRNDAGVLSIVVRPGQHTVELTGPIPHVDRFELPFPTPVGNVALDLNGWRAYGEQDGHLRGGSLQFEREAPAAAADATSLSSEPIAPYVSVSRTFDFGREWRIHTVVTRIAPSSGGIPFAIPLVAGESLLDGSVRADNGRAIGVVPPGDRYVEWHSALAETAQFTLTAPPLTERTEEWTLVPSNAWHVDYEASSGLAPLKLGTDVAPGPRFEPLPGETLTIRPTRPTPLAGRTITVERVDLTESPGARARRSTLQLDLLSSQGGNYAVRLPDGAKVLTIALNGAPQPIPAAASTLPLPIVPGEQHAVVTWETPLEIGAVLRTSAVELAGPAYNIGLNVELPQDRWPLFVGGPRLGPAILFWGVLVVVLAVATVLARVPGLPLNVRDGVLLGFGMTLCNLPSTVLVAAWLLLLLARERYATRVHALSLRSVQLIQVGLALVTLAALVALAASVPTGLLGAPDMQIVGYNSSQYEYHWFQDQAATLLPSAYVVSLPIWIYRVVMLAWSLWLAFAIIRWARWSWSAFTAGGGWKSAPRPAPFAPPAQTPTP